VEHPLRVPVAYEKKSGVIMSSILGKLSNEFFSRFYPQTIILLDSPISKTVADISSPDAQEDVYAFSMLFVALDPPVEKATAYGILSNT
jgi:hypothetical protein